MISYTRFSSITNELIPWKPLYTRVFFHWFSNKIHGRYQLVKLIHGWRLLMPLQTFLTQRRVWRYQKGNPNLYIEEQTTQWSKEKVQKAKQRSTKHTHKTKDRVTRTPLKTGGELKCFGRVGSSCSTSSGTRRVNLVTNPVTSHHREKTGKYLRQVEHIRGLLWHRYSILVNQVMVTTVKHSKWWLQLNQGNPSFSSFLVSSNPLSRKSW